MNWSVSIACFFRNAAFARYEELTSGATTAARIENAATRSWDRFFRAWDARDWERVTAIFLLALFGCDVFRSRIEQSLQIGGRVVLHAGTEQDANHGVASLPDCGWESVIGREV
jgi:hypothetical protein